MDPDRLAELQRQRAIVRDHLAWLENEISAATGNPVPRTASPHVATTSPAASTTPPLHDATIGSSPSDPGIAAATAKRGCLTIAIAVLLLGLVGLAVIYFVSYRDRPIIFMSHDQPVESRK